VSHLETYECLVLVCCQAKKTTAAKTTPVVNANAPDSDCE